MGGFLDFLKGLGAPRLVAMLAVTLTLVGFFGFVAMRVSETSMVPVFTDLSMQDASAVSKELEAQGITFQTSRDGTTILVPIDNVAQIRMKLAEQGLPSGGGVGWEIFDKGDGLSSTSFLQNVNKMRALEGELARSIRALNRVRAARVHLVLPERPLFSRDAPKPSASIVLRVAGDLSQSEVRAIMHLVASAVQGLSPEAISIVDEGGRLLANGSDVGVDGAPAGAQEREAAFEKRIKDQVQGIVERVVGPGRARAEVNASFDYSKITNTADLFDPESRVIRSTQTREEETDSNERQATVTVGNQVPNAQANANTDQPSNRETSSKADETVNYEISRTTRTEVLEAGRLKKVSVAVLVDGIYETDPSGSVTYAPRSQQELDSIAAIVRSTIGFDQGRGDQIEVINLRFAEPPSINALEDSAGAMEMSREDLMRIIELTVLGIVSLLVLLIVVRPLVRRILTPEAKPELPVIAAPEMASDTAVPALPGPDPTARMIELAQVNGKVHAQSLQKIGELAENNPSETVSIIRQWLAQPA